MTHEILIKGLGLERAKVRGNEIQCSCPFASLTHTSGLDRTPSFSLNVEKGVYNCFTCGKHGVIEELVEEVLNISKMSAIEYLESIGFSRLDLAIQSFEREKYLPSGEFDLFIPEAILEAFTLLDATNEIYQGEVDGQNCLVYAVRNYLGQLVGAEARSTEKRWHKHLWDMKKSHYLYGENLILHKDEMYPLVIVEGVGDCIAIRQCIGSQYVVALMGAHASDIQINKLLRFADTFTVWLDNDNAGYRGTSRLFKDLEPRALEVFYVSPAEVPEGCNDPRDVFQTFGPEAVIEVINSAKTYLEFQGDL